MGKQGSRRRERREIERGRGIERVRIGRGREIGDRVNSDQEKVKERDKEKAER